MKALISVAATQAISWFPEHTKLVFTSATCRSPACNTIPLPLQIAYPLLLFTTFLICYFLRNGNPFHYSRLGNPMDRGVWRAAAHGVTKSRTQLSMHTLIMSNYVSKTEKVMAPHSSTFAWRIPWMEEPDRLQSMGSLESDTPERLHFDFSLLCIGEGHGNPLQCSCLESPRDGGAWWAAVYRIAQSRTRLKRLSSSSSSRPSKERILIQSLVEGEGEVAQSCPTLCDPMDPAGFSVHRIFQARILEWVTISFSRGSSPPRDRIFRHPLL